MPIKSAHLAGCNVSKIIRQILKYSFPENANLNDNNAS